MHQLILASVLHLSLLSTSQSNDSLKITIQQADSIFLHANYQLLASAMNVDAQRAQIIQAKLYPNPYATADFNAYDPVNNETFHTGPTGQKSFQLEQLILLAGKRKAQIELAKTNAAIAELEFQDAVRQLKFQLHTALYSLNEQRLLLEKYADQLALLETIVSNYEVQVQKGNIALKDIVRLKGVFLNLNNERAELLEQHLEDLGRVQTILQVQSHVVPVIAESELGNMIQTLTYDELNDVALSSRPDVQIAQKNKIAAEQYYQFQRRLAIPDLNVIGSYDQRGGAFVNQVNIGVAMPLPLWNRNQGNIKSAKFGVQQTIYSEQGLRSRVGVEVLNSLAIYKQSIDEYAIANRLYNQDFDITLKGMTDNFQKRNVSLIEFVDFFEAYNNALKEIARIKIQLAESAEQLNLVVGKDIL